jgi:hypothetical protein
MFEWVKNVFHSKRISLIAVPSDPEQFRLFIDNFYDDTKENIASKSLSFWFNYLVSEDQKQIEVDSDFLYLLAFSLKLQNLTLKALDTLIQQFNSKSRLCSIVFFFFFRRFIEQEKKNQSPNKDFNLKKFEKPIFIECLRLISELILKQIFQPNR